MKHVYQLIMPFVACLAAALTGCSDNELVANNGGKPTANYYSQLGVSLNAETRLSYDEETTQVKVTWNTGDRIKLIKQNASDTGLDEVIFEIKDPQYDGKKDAIFHISDDTQAYTGTPSASTYNPEIAYKAIYPATLTADPTSNAQNAYFEVQEQDGANMNHVGKYNAMVGYKQPKVGNEVDVTIYSNTSYNEEGMSHISSVVKTIVRAPSAYATSKPQIVKLIVKDTNDKTYIIDLNLKNVTIDAATGTFPAYFTIPYNTGFREIEVEASFAKQGTGSSVIMGSVAKTFKPSSDKATEFGKIYDLKVDFLNTTPTEAEGVNMGGVIWSRYNLGVDIDASATEAQKEAAEAKEGKYYQWGMLDGWTWGQTGISAATSKLNDATQERLKKMFGKTIKVNFGFPSSSFPGTTTYEFSPNYNCGEFERVDMQGMIVTTPEITYQEVSYKTVTNATQTSAKVDGIAVFSKVNTDEYTEDGLYYYITSTTDTNYKLAYGHQYKKNTSSWTVGWYRDKACTNAITVSGSTRIFKKVIEDKKIEAGTYGDAATKELGAAWQMPNVLQIQALIAECLKPGGKIENVTKTISDSSGTKTVKGIQFTASTASGGATFFYPAAGAWDTSWGGFMAAKDENLRYYCSTSALQYDQNDDPNGNQTAYEFHVYDVDKTKFTICIHTSHGREAACPIRPVARLSNAF